MQNKTLQKGRKLHIEFAELKEDTEMTRAEDVALTRHVDVISSF